MLGAQRHQRERELVAVRSGLDGGREVSAQRGDHVVHLGLVRVLHQQSRGAEALHADDRGPGQRGGGGRTQHHGGRPGVVRLVAAQGDLDPRLGRQLRERCVEAPGRLRRQHSSRSQGMPVAGDTIDLTGLSGHVTVTARFSG
ncbi:hypothetical protein ACQP2K_31290 [Microbispora siamensis]